MSKGTFEKGTLRPEVLSQFGNSGHDGDVIFSDSWISSRSRRRGTGKQKEKSYQFGFKLFTTH